MLRSALFSRSQGLPLWVIARPAVQTHFGTVVKQYEEADSFAVILLMDEKAITSMLHFGTRGALISV
jgi:hypothetical protein